LTSTWCECGCGFEGEDDVTQFCIEEAALIALDIETNRELEADTPEAKPGEITDPVMADAMAKAKELHFKATGVRVQ
jgi:hypothetical protein